MWINERQLIWNGESTILVEGTFLAWSKNETSDRQVLNRIGRSNSDGFPFPKKRKKGGRLCVDRKSTRLNSSHPV